MRHPMNGLSSRQRTTPHRSRPSKTRRSLATATACDWRTIRRTFDGCAAGERWPDERPVDDRQTFGAMARKQLAHELASLMEHPMPDSAGPPTPFATPASSSQGQHGHSKTSGLNGSRQKFDDGSFVIEATEELSAVRDNELDSSLIATWRQQGKGNVIDVQQTNYSYKNRVLPPVTLFTNLNDIPAEVPPEIG